MHAEKVQATKKNWNPAYLYVSDDSRGLGVHIKNSYSVPGSQAELEEFKFDHVFETNIDQEEAFSKITEPLKPSSPDSTNII